MRIQKIKLIFKNCEKKNLKMENKFYLSASFSIPYILELIVKKEYRKIVDV